MEARQKVLIITYYWPPSGGAGVQRWLKFVKYLPHEHIQPYVLTVDPSDASYPVLDQSLLRDIAPDARVFRTKSREPYAIYQKMTRARHIPMGGFANDSNPSLLQRISRFIRGNFFLPDPRRGWNKFAVAEASRLIREEHIQTIITTSPPHSSQLIGLTLKKRFAGLKWIADLRDPWTDIYYYDSLFPTRWARKKDARYERDVLTSADEIIVVSQQLKRGFLSKAVIPPGKIKVIPNGYDPDDFPGTTPSPPVEPVITFVGTITSDYPLDGLFDALSLLGSQGLYPRVKFVGKQSLSIATEVSRRGLSSQVIFTDYVEHACAVDIMRNSNVLLLVIPGVANNKAILTGKLFEYLAAQRPVLCLGPVDGDAAAILSECKAGSTFEYRDATGIAAFLFPFVSPPEGPSSWQPGPSDSYARPSLTRQLAAMISG